MCLALAESRGWVVATDDRKAVRVAGQAGLTVVSTPAIVKAWADATRPDPALTLPYLTLPYLTLPFLTLPYLTLPYLTLPYLTLPYLT